MSGWFDWRCLRTVVHFAADTTYFAVRVRTLQLQPSAAPWRCFNETGSLGPRHAGCAYAALGNVPSLFKSFKKSIETASFRLRLTPDMALMKTVDPFNQTRELS